MTLTFLTPWLLAGSALIALPIIIHLILKKQPKHLMFPAFRFLQQKHRTNLRKLRLRHWLLLAMRMLLILLMCWALARPFLSGGTLEFASDSPLGVVLVFDTSASMEYEQDGKSRLEEAKERALRFLDYLPSGSQVAVVDTAESTAQFASVRDATQQVKNRRPRPLNRPVTAALGDVYRLLEKPPELPLLICIFSDRTAASWSGDAADVTLRQAKHAVEEKLGRPVPCLYVDFGSREPRNVALVGVGVKQGESDLARPIESIPFGTSPRRPQLQATVQVTGASIDQDLVLYMDGKIADTRRLKISAQPGQVVTEVVTFLPLFFPDEPASQVHQGEIRLKSRDALEADNSRYWTLASTQRRVLLVADQKEDASDLADALETLRLLPISCTIITPREVPAAILPDQYQAVCLINVAKPSNELWESLGRYVTAGGGLIVLPGDDCEPEAYRTTAAAAVMPARLTKKREVPAPGALLAPNDYDHAVLAPFKVYERRNLPGRIYKFWDLDRDDKVGLNIMPYSLEDRPPALVERVFDPQKVQGRVLLFTTAMYRREQSWKDWNTIYGNWLYQGLGFFMTRYVMGARDEQQNFTLRDDMRFWLPQGAGLSAYTLTGPETGIGEIKPGQSQLVVQEAKRAGNYKVSAGNAWGRNFSANIPPHETQLLQDRPEPAVIEALLGEQSVFAIADVPDLQEVARSRLGQAPELDLLPLLMIGVVLLLAGENLLANKFYRNEAESGEKKPVLVG